MKIDGPTDAILQLPTQLSLCRSEGSTRSSTSKVEQIVVMFQETTWQLSVLGKCENATSLRGVVVFAEWASQQSIFYYNDCYTKPADDEWLRCLAVCETTGSWKCAPVCSSYCWPAEYWTVCVRNQLVQFIDLKITSDFFKHVWFF